MSEELMPDKNGRFGIYGGRYVAETLVPALEELSEQYELIKNEDKFLKEFKDDLAHYVGRPSPYILLNDGLNCLVEQRSILREKT